MKKKECHRSPLFSNTYHIIREDSQIDLGMPVVNLTYGGGVQPMTFRKRLKIP